MTIKTVFIHSLLIALALLLFVACGKKKEVPPSAEKTTATVVAVKPDSVETGHTGSIDTQQDAAAVKPLRRAACKERETASLYQPVKKTSPESETPPTVQALPGDGGSTPSSDSRIESVPEATPVCSSVGTETVAPQAASPQAPSHAKSRYFALKTNLASWATGAINLAADVRVSRHISIELPVHYSPWDISRRYALRQFTLQPEGRYWFTSAGEGHFMGIHAHCSWFNVKWGDYRYQSTRALYGAGLSYGYRLPLAHRWGLEFNLGAGYMNTRFDKYYNINNGSKIETGQRTYWGITRLGISLVYRLK